MAERAKKGKFSQAAPADVPFKPSRIPVAKVHGGQHPTKPSHNRSRPRLLSTVDETETEVVPQTRTTKDRPTEIQIPTKTSTHLDVKEYRKPLVSPIPLPAGVVCIDPPDDHLFAYGMEHMKYLKGRETRWVVDTDQLMKGYDTNIKRNRSILTDWLISICHYMHFSQETLYHTIGLLDRALDRRVIDDNHLQLVGVTCLFIASKMEEYYPADPEKLADLTEKAFDVNQIFNMEHTLLKVFQFDCYTVEPHVFLTRYIRAAEKDVEGDFHEWCILMVDCTITSIEYSSIPSSLKAAGGVLAALHLVSAGTAMSQKECAAKAKDLWTPSLQYYTGFEEKQVLDMSYKMMFILLKVQRNDENQTYDSVRKKYRSQSKHRGLLVENEGIFSEMKIMYALKAMKERKETLQKYFKSLEPETVLCARFIGRSIV